RPRPRRAPLARPGGIGTGVAPARLPRGPAAGRRGPRRSRRRLPRAPARRRSRTREAAAQPPCGARRVGRRAAGAGGAGRPAGRRGGRGREHVRGLRLRPRPRQARVRRAQAELLARLSGMPVVAGAGMAGLVCAARLRELGRPAVVLEKGDRPGGSMLLSSGVVWRHRTFERFREECPDGDPVLQRVLFERLDDALDWLEAVAVRAVATETGNELTTGRRFETRALTDALVRAAGDLRLREPVHELPDEEVVLATGGFV